MGFSGMRPGHTGYRFSRISNSICPVYLQAVYLFLLLVVVPARGFGANVIPREQRCMTFSEPDLDLKEFYSPMYPSFYPNSTDCVLKLTAPFGHVIRMDFRDYFELEEAEHCENDFLEIRDGHFGYNDLIGKYCGSRYPPIITSSDRYLWLMFRSDYAVEKKGFRAVFEYIIQDLGRPHVEPCQFELTEISDHLSHEDISLERLNYTRKYKLDMDCTWKINVRHGNKIYLFFEKFSLAQPNECTQNFVSLFDYQNGLLNEEARFCGSVAESVTTKGNVLYFRFFAKGQARYDSKFKAWYTAYRERIAPDSGPEEEQICYEDEFDCDDATCIDSSLECNGVNNCRHMYDEENCDDLQKLKFDITSQHIIVILTMGCGLLGGMCFAMCFNCIRKLVRDGRQIHENIRRSREQLEGRPRSVTSIPSTPTTLGVGGPLRRPTSLREEEYLAKANGRPHLPHASSEENEDDDDLDDEMDDELDEEDDETSVEMRDFECQTRNSMTSQRGSLGHRTPPPPPPPSRRPPVPSSLSPEPVPTPPPPPSAHYNRGSHFEIQNETDPYRYRAHAMIHVPEKGKQAGKTSTGSNRSQSRTGKTTPDVLVSH